MKNSKKSKIIPFLVYPIGIKFFGVLNFADVLVLRHLKFNVIFQRGVTASIFFVLLTLIQSLIFGNEIKPESFYLVTKILFASLWIGAFYGERIIFNWKLVVFLYLPIFISVAGFVFDGINSFIVDLWGVNNSQTWRYGGIFGDDVNSYGCYATMAAIFLIATKKYSKISWMLIALFLSFSAFSIMISGMRAGVISILAAGIIVFLFNGDAFKYVKHAFLKLFIVIGVAYFFVLNFISDDYLNILTDRFSVQALMEDLNPDGDGNIVVAVDFFDRLVPGEISFLKFLIGIDSSISFVDNAYLFIFIQYGIFGVLIFGYFYFLICREILRWDHQKKSFFGKFILIFTLIIGLKGIFPLAGYYILILLMILGLVDNSESNL